MELYEHALISAAVAPLAVWQIYGIGSFFAPLVLFGFCCGVFIDLDHFLVQRLRDGNWNHLKAAFQNFTKLAKNNQKVLEDPISEKSRYISHFALLSISPLIALAISPKLAALTFTMLASHTFCDLLRSWRGGAEILD